MRVTGHRLIGKGAPHTSQSCQRWPCDVHAGVQRVNRTGEAKTQGIGGHGHALCECGWTGGHRLTGSERKRDHDSHKASLRPAA
jgi:hypothetical protein